MLPFTRVGDLRLLHFESFDSKVTQAVFARHGGVSPDPWASLNLGGTVGDDPQRVRENKRRALAAVDCDPGSVFDVWQVHGVEVVVADAPLPPGTPHTKADAILSDRSGVTLMMRFADCVPVLLHDPIKKVVGIAHAGWLGTVRGAARAAVETMHDCFGSNPKDITAAIGPSIGPDHYEVGADVVGQVRQAFGHDSTGLLIRHNGQTYLDLWTANRLLLEKAGVRRIECSGHCTACSTEDWFSHRAEKGRTGRFGAVIALKP